MYVYMHWCFLYWSIALGNRVNVRGCLPVQGHCGQQQEDGLLVYLSLKSYSPLVLLTVMSASSLMGPCSIALIKRISLSHQLVYNDPMCVCVCVCVCVLLRSIHCNDNEN